MSSHRDFLVNMSTDVPLLPVPPENKSAISNRPLRAGASHFGVLLLSLAPYSCSDMLDVLLAASSLCSQRASTLLYGAGTA